MRMKTIWCVCLLLAACATLGFGQNYGTVGGTVKDQSGAVVPGAAVVVTNTATGTVSRVSSLADGKFLVNALQPGTYQLAVDAAGFKKYLTSGFEVHVADNVMIDVPLEVGGGAESVTVTAEAPMLRVADVQTGEIVDNNFIKNMPQLNRNPFALVALSGNVQGSGDTLTLNGGRTSATDYYIDGGVVNTGRSNRRANVTPSMDAVAEFKVVTSGISAEFGRISGGYVTLVTKSGSNDYHGSMYEYMFNDMFNANSWQQNGIGAKKAHFRQNDYGFTLGGPVVIPKIYSGKNKTFFFVDNEYYKRTNAGTISLQGVPTPLERAGDYTQTLYNGKYYPAYDPYGPQVYNASKGLWERTGLLGGDGKHVPAGLIDSTSVALLKFVPAANRAPQANSSSQNNYGHESSSSSDNFRFGVRMDQNLTESQRLNLRYTNYSQNTSTLPTSENPLYTSSVSASDGGLNANLNYTWSIQPTLILDLKGSVTHNPTFSGNTHAAGFSNSYLPAIYAQYLGPDDIPSINNTFMNGTAIGQPGSSSTTNSTTYAFSGSLTKVRTSHTLKIGGEHRRYYDNFYSGGGSSNVVQFMYNQVAQFQGDWGLGAAEGRTTAMAAMLLGTNSRNNIAKPTTRAMNTNYFGLFIQDDWKLSSKLTVNLGVRYDNERPTTERMDKLYFWNPDHASLFPIIAGYDLPTELRKVGLDPAAVPIPDWWTKKGFKAGSVGIAGTPDFPGRSPQILNNMQFAPRIGFAFQADRKTVIRAYGGKMYLPTTGNANSYATSNSNVALSDQAIAGWHASTDGGRNYISSWKTPFPLASMFTKYSKDLMTVNQQSSIDPGPNVVNRKLAMPREYTYSIDIQRQLPFNLVTQVGYTANRGYGLLATNLESHYPAPLLKPQYAAAMQTFVKSPNAGETLETTITGTNQPYGLLMYDFPYYGRLQVSGLNLGRSRYDALNVRLEKRMSQGLSVLLNYTRGHLVDDVGGADGANSKSVQSIDDYHKVWGLSSADRKHSVNLAYTFEFPFGRGKKLLGKPSNFAMKALDAVVGGWVLAGNFSWRSGAPIGMTGSTNSNINNGVIKVNQTWANYSDGAGKVDTAGTADHNLVMPGFKDLNQVLIGPLQSYDTPTFGDCSKTSTTQRYLNPCKVLPAQAWYSGTIDPLRDEYRNAGNYTMDMSLMKNFRIKEGVTFQFRAEGQNAWNIRGLGGVSASAGSPGYGLITSAGNTARQIQLSARINF